MTKEKFVKNMGVLHLATVTGDEDIVKRLFKGILAHFPNNKADLEHYVYDLNFGKPSSDSECEDYETFYQRLIQ